MNAAKKSLESEPIEILTTPSDKCPYYKCDGSGWIWKRDWSKRHKKLEQDEWQEECECYVQMQKQKEIERKIEIAQVPPIFQNATVKSFDVNIYKQQESRDAAVIARKAAANYVSNYQTMKQNGKGLYLYSEVKGSGKTRLISSVGNALVKVYGCSLAFMQSDDMLAKIRNTYGNPGEGTEAEILKVFREVDVLIIDDIAVEKHSEFAEKILYNILNYRLEHSKTTLFTSNRMMEDLDSLYPEGRIGSRVKKLAIEIYMPEESIRDQEAAEESVELEKILFE